MERTNDGHVSNNRNNLTSHFVFASILIITILHRVKLLNSLSDRDAKISIPDFCEKLVPLGVPAETPLSLSMES